MRVIYFTAIAVLALTLAACGERDRAASEDGFAFVNAPVQAPSGQPRLVAGDEGLLFSWVETSDAGAELRYAWFRGNEWEAPRTAARGDDWFVNWADTPGVVPLADGRLLAFYLQRTGRQPYAYGIRVITSEGNGEWSEPIIPHRGRYPTEYGFVSVVPQDDGSARLFWLDGTEMFDPEAENGHGHGHGGGGPMTIRTALLAADGSIEQEHLVDDRACECCPTTAVSIPGGEMVAYRDRSMEEVRDIAAVRITREGATQPTIPARDDWTIAGCPVNGPSAAARGEDVSLAWFTGVEGGQVRLARSDDGGLTFAPPLRIDDGQPTGRVATAMLDDGSVMVSWLEAGHLRLRRVDPEGVAQPSMEIAAVPSDRATGMPQLAVYDGRVWAAWVDVDARQVRMAQAPIDAVP